LKEGGAVKGGVAGEQAAEGVAGEDAESGIGAVVAFRERNDFVFEDGEKLVGVASALAGGIEEGIAAGSEIEGAEAVDVGIFAGVADADEEQVGHGVVDAEIAGDGGEEREVPVGVDEVERGEFARGLGEVGGGVADVELVGATVGGSGEVANFGVGERVGRGGGGGEEGGGEEREKDVGGGHERGVGGIGAGRRTAETTGSTPRGAAILQTPATCAG